MVILGVWGFNPIFIFFSNVEVLNYVAVFSIEFD